MSAADEADVKGAANIVYGGTCTRRRILTSG